MTDFGKKILIGGIVLISLMILLFVWRSMQILNNDTTLVSSTEAPQATTTIFESVELKSHKDFKLIGTKMYEGGGNEPGWAFKLNLAGNKFGIDMLTKYGEMQYVGYIDLTNQSTSSKKFAGKVFDTSDTVQDVSMEIKTEKCIQPSGEEVEFTVTVKVADEDLTGCAKLAN